MRKLTGKEESFAQAYVLHKSDSMQAYKHSEYSQDLKPDHMSVQAYKLRTKPHISLRIDALQSRATAIAEEKFTVSVEWRLKALKAIHDAGIGTYLDAQGNARLENLAAAKGAIETLNAMLGSKEENDKVTQPIAIGIIDAS